MPAHIGVTSLDGHAAPAVGAVQSRESELTLGFEEEKDAAGVSKYLVPHKYSRKEVSISGVGDAELSSAVSSGNITAGTFKVLSAKQTEFNSALPKFERKGVLLANLA